MTKRKNDKKVRSNFIYGTTRNEVDHLDLEFDISTDSFEFKTKMVNRYTEVSYDRAKGPKVIARTPVIEGKSYFSTDMSMMNHFDFIAAVDTNTKIIRGYKISVSGISFCMRMFAVDSEGVIYTEHGGSGIHSAWNL